MIDWEDFFQRFREFMAGSVKDIVAPAVSFFGPLLLALIAHFSGYVAYFGMDIASLLDAGSVASPDYSPGVRILVGGGGVVL